MDKKKMTIKDIAKYCNVGTSTVSRVINQKQEVKPETQEKILKAIKDFNYIPNSNAQNLKRISTMNVGVVIKEFTNPFFSQMIPIIENEFRKNGYTISILPVESETNEVAMALPFCKEKKLEGLIFLGGRFNHSKHTLEKITIPFVFCTFTNKFGNCDDILYSSVSVDDEMEAYKAIMYLHSLGHKKIAFIGIDNKDKSISELRYKGYKKALKDLNIKLNYNIIVETKKFELQRAYDATQQLLIHKNQFTAIFVISDAMSIAICKCCVDNGYNIPSDISVLGFDGIEFGKYMTPTLATLKQPTYEMALKSSQVLLELLTHNIGNKHYTFNATIIEGGTCQKNIEQNGGIL